MDVLFLEAPYSGKVELTQETLHYLKQKKYTKVGLYASVQFCNQLNIIKEQLTEAKITALSSRPDRTHVSTQLLGCDVYHDSLNSKEAVDCYLYVGDGKFHPLALVYLQKDAPSLKEVVCNDPIQKSMEVLSIANVKTIVTKYKASLMKFLTADTVGIIITIKPGQEHLQPSFALQKKYPQKRFYYFIDNVVSFDQLENFNFIQVWVNTTCPRVGFDDQEKFEKGVINLNDALQAEEILQKDSLLTRL
ncbi:MAG: diphthamide synthesis protein [Nanoarchaeota archaeon]|nr:diphthamide synthesis protein [Nanoarchaeota archaeon]